MNEMDISQTLDLAVSHHRESRLKEAENLYQRILQVSPQHPDALHLLGVLAFQTGESKKAVLLIEKAIGVFPNNPSFYNNLGNALKSLGKLGDAIAAYERALSLQPAFADAYCNLGIVLKDQGKFEDAIAAYRNSLSLNKDSPETHNNLGNVYRQQGKFEDAIVSYRQAIDLKPGFPEAHNNLGNALKETDQFEEALRAFRNALELNPQYPEVFNNLGNTLKDLGQMEDAIASYRRAIEIKPGFADAHYNLAIALRDQENIQEALEEYRLAYELNPHNMAAKHMRDALQGNNPELPPQDYVKDLFDGFSANFDHHLLNKLEYITPAYLRQTVEGVIKTGATFKDGIDLGCGTGLGGKEFRHLIEHWTGVDVSPGMLEKAREKTVYETLVNEDIIGYLNRTEQSYDFFLATDVFMYLGNLEPIFEAVKKRSQHRAYFAFSVERGDSTSYKLMRSGRYAHSPDYIRSLAEQFGFQIQTQKTANIRKEKGQWVQGDLFVMSRKP